MQVDNGQIATTFQTLADLLEIEGANPFRIRAYREAARLVGGMSQNVARLVRAGRDLSELPGIGKDLADKIRTVAETGRLPLLEEVTQRIPGSLAQLTRIEGLGPKRVKTLYKVLGIASLEQLDAALAAGRVRELPGFGVRTEQIVRDGLKRLRALLGRNLLAEVEPVARALQAYLSAIPGVRQVQAAGSYRRRRETVGDLDLLVTCRQGAEVMKAFAAYESVSRVLALGDTRSSVRLDSGLQVDLRVVPEVSYGAALHYFTGSKAHNIAVRKLAVARGLKINEYGVFRGKRRVAGRREKEVFEAVDLPFIEPELREDRGEIAAARDGRLPNLVRREDLHGDLHVHTAATDGRNTLEEMVRAASESGYEYIAITDHSRAVSVAHGLDPARLREQLREIERLRGRFPIRILAGIEVDILEDGRLDLPDGVLAELDLTICSIHTHFDLPESKQNRRILRAMDNRHFRILGHPTGRILNQRESYAVDLERVMAGAAERGRFLELNSQPARLDLTDSACQRAKELGVKVAICSDAHARGQLDHIRFGIGQARRGWLEPDDVLNTRTIDELRAMLKEP